MERTVYLALGARDGGQRNQLVAGLAGLRENGLTLLAASSLWETEPIAIAPGPPVLNAAVAMRTSLSPPTILTAGRSVEAAAGRRRSSPEWRSLDVDILLDGGLILEGPELTIPHPRFHSRRFNLEPLCEIAPDVLHPRLGVTISELLRSCADPAWARRIEPPSWAMSVETPATVR